MSRRAAIILGPINPVGVPGTSFMVAGVPGAGPGEKAKGTSACVLLECMSLS